MTMDDLDTLLRQTFREKEAEAPDADRLAARVRAASVARHVTVKRRLLVAGTACAVAGVAVAVTVQTSGGGGSQGAPATGPTFTDGRPTDQVVGGMRAWSSSGLQVRAPESWPANALHCSTAAQPTVIVDVSMYQACLGPDPHVDQVEFRGAQALAATPEHPSVPVSEPPFYPNTPTMRPTKVDGRDAQIGSMRLADGRTLEVLIIPDLDVSVGATTKDPALAERIIASAHVVDVDANGCPSRTAAVVPGKPTRDGADRDLVPGTPIAASLCSYGHDFEPTGSKRTGPVVLGHSQAIAPQKLDALVSMLNALPPGLRSFNSPAGSCTPADRAGTEVRFFYQSGPPLDVYLHTSTCDHLGFDNGARTGALDRQFPDMVSGYLPSYSFAFYPNTLQQ
jgi:hypothetical protein